MKPMESFCGVQDYKQHLNISPYAFDIIKSDMLAFGCDSTTTFINHIFRNYYELADANITESVKRARNELEEKLASIPHSQPAIDQLVELKEKELKKQALSYPGGCPIKIRLQNDIHEYLDSENHHQPPCPEKAHYSRAGQYVKAVIEEYTRKPFLDREAIYLQKKLNAIESCIAMKKQLVITVQSGVRYWVLPYRIVRDTYHYLVGESYPIGGLVSQASPCSFRLSKAQRVEDKEKKSFLSEADKRRLDTLIKEKGVPFVGGKTDIIRVRLTEQGKEMYQNILHLRPPCLEEKEENGSVYIFGCSPRQIELYFIRFGKHAQVLSPAYLAEKIQTFYREALEQQTLALEPTASDVTD